MQQPPPPPYPQPYAAPAYPPQFGPFYPPPKPPPNIRGIFRLVMFLISMPVLGIVVYAIVTFELEKKRDMIVFDNRLETPADVFVDGKKLETIAPHATYANTVKLPEHAKHLEVRAAGQVVSAVDLAIPPRGPNEKNGYRGLYVIGATRRYVLAKVPYYEKMPAPPVFATKTPLPAASPLAELPRDLESFELNIDNVFLESESVPGGTDVYWKKHICSLGDDGQIGCHGYPTTSVPP